MSRVLDEPKHPKYDEHLMFYYRMGSIIMVLSGVGIVYFMAWSILTVVQHQVSGYTLIIFLLGLDSIAPIICVSSSNHLLLNPYQKAKHHRFLRNFFGLLSTPLVAALLFFALIRLYMGLLGKVHRLDFLFWTGVLLSMLLGGLFMLYFVQTAKIINKDYQ